MQTLSRMILGLGVALFAAGCGPSPVELTQSFDSAINAKTVDAAMALIAPDATLTIDGKEFKGAEQVKAQLAQLTAQNLKSELVGQYQLEGDKVTGTHKVTTDEYTKLAVAPLEAKHEITAVSGKIASITITTTPESVAKIDAAIAAGYRKVVDDFHAALAAKNLDAAMALLADDATLTVADKVLTGKDQVKEHLTALFGQNFSAAAGERTVKGNKVSYTAKLATDEWTKGNIAPLDANNEAVVENGKIKTISMLLTAEATTKLQSLTAQAEAPKKGKAK